MITSVSRWVSPDGFTAYVHIEGGGAYSIKHFYNGEKEKTFVAPLVHMGEGVYWYKIPAVKKKEEADPEPLTILANFIIYDDSDHILVKYMVDTLEYPEEPSDGDGQEKIPTHAIESRAISNGITRVWAHYPWTPFQRKVSVANATPSPLSAAFYTVTVPDDKLFASCFQPKIATREQITEKLSDPVALFNGDTGTAFLVEAEQKIVVPLSNHGTAWTEEYPVKTFLNITMDWSTEATRPPFYTPTLYGKLTETKKVPITTTSSNSRTYRTSEIPAAFTSEISTIESNYRKTTFNAPSYNFGSGVGLGFQTAPGGVIYGVDNFLSYS